MLKEILFKVKPVFKVSNLLRLKPERMLLKGKQSYIKVAQQICK